jgi:hypothetical protein
MFILNIYRPHTHTHTYLLIARCSCVYCLHFNAYTYNRFTNDDLEYTLEKYTEMKIDDKRMLEAWRDARIAMVHIYTLIDKHSDHVSTHIHTHTHHA